MSRILLKEFSASSVLVLSGQSHCVSNAGLGSFLHQLALGSDSLCQMNTNTSYFEMSSLNKQTVFYHLIHNERKLRA